MNYIWGIFLMLKRFFPQITMSSTWAFEDFKAAILEDVGTPSISDINLKVYTYPNLYLFILTSKDVSFLMYIVICQKYNIYCNSRYILTSYCTLLLMKIFIWVCSYSVRMLSYLSIAISAIVSCGRILFVNKFRAMLNII